MNFGVLAGPLILPLDPYDRSVEHFWSAYINDMVWFIFPNIYNAKFDSYGQTNQKKFTVCDKKS